MTSAARKAAEHGCAVQRPLTATMSSPHARATIGHATANVTVNTVADGVYLAGDFSGIQRFVLRVKSAGKAQAKRLRARSFLLELVERAALWHVEQRCHTSDDDVLIRGGGGFLVRLRADADRAQLERLETDLQRLLWEEFGGELQFALGWAATPADARAALERRKRQPGRAVLQSRGSWDVERLTRPSLAEPCQVCGEFPGFRNVHEDEEDRVVRHCRSCLDARTIGANLTLRQWLRAGQGSIRALGVAFDLLPARQAQAWRVGRWIPRAKASNLPLTFQDLSRHSRGDPRLAVLKADVDDMGVRVGKIAAGDPSCGELRAFSRTLHRFFAERMQDAMAQRRRLIYTLYSGGDDLLLIAPWQVMLDFASELVHQFQQGPAREYGPLTLSAGITLTPYRVPIRHAVERAEVLLDAAKGHPGKNRCAALGTSWSWDRHAPIVGHGKRIADAVESDAIPRALLHRLLQLAEGSTEQERQPRAARWAYQISRNVPRVGERAAKFRRWAQDAMRHFDGDTQRVNETAASLRYALLATRSRMGGRDE